MLISSPSLMAVWACTAILLFYISSISFACMLGKSTDGVFLWSSLNVETPLRKYSEGDKKILLVWSELLGDFFWGSIFVLVSLIDAAPISEWLKETVCIALCSILIWKCWNRSSSGFIPKFYCAQGLKRISGFDTTYHGWWRAKGAPEHLSKKLTNRKWYT